MSGSAPWFNGREHDPATGGTSFPVGRHLSILKGGQRAPVKDKPTEGMLVFTVEIIDGPHKGISGVYRLNMWNSNPQASEIASRQLSALCCVTGRFDISSPNASELFGIPFFILVQQQPEPNAQYTQIVGVLDANGQQPVKGQGPAAPQGQQQPQQPQPQYAPPQQPGGFQGQPQQPAAPNWQAPGQQPAPQQQQPMPQQQPAPSGQPNWAPPGGQPQPQYAPPQVQQQQPAAPSWSQQPQGQAKPSWAG